MKNQNKTYVIYKGVGKGAIEYRHTITIKKCYELHREGSKFYHIDDDSGFPSFFTKDDFIKVTGNLSTVNILYGCK